LRQLLGGEKPTAGVALYEGKPAAEWDRAELARSIGVVTQLEEIVFPLTVRELVAMGRYPHLGAYRSERAEDHDAIDAALSYCDLADLASRPMNTLSGGERQRARIARALAQKPRVLVLDEPTAALDIAHEMSIFQLLDSLVVVDGVTVVVVTHNINIAARYASQLVLLERGRIAAAGAPADVLAHARVESTYHWPVTVHPFAGPGRDTGAPQVAPLRRETP
jgi:iron complex transport system ATP-binding protein